MLRTLDIGVIASFSMAVIITPVYYMIPCLTYVIPSHFFFCSFLINARLSTAIVKQLFPLPQTIKRYLKYWATALPRIRWFSFPRPHSLLSPLHYTPTTTENQHGLCYSNQWFSTFIRTRHPWKCPGHKTLLTCSVYSQWYGGHRLKTTGSRNCLIGAVRRLKNERKYYALNHRCVRCAIAL